MIDKVGVERCCICKACSEICPVGAICLTKEEKGFYYPEIDMTKCISCNKCENVCPELVELSLPEDGYPIAFGAKSKNDETRLKSTSGGIFYEAARYILQQGGYVCGVVFEDEFQVVHKLTNDEGVLEKMRGSKYAQSDTKGIYRDIKSCLEKGKAVLFDGTPCQVTALKMFLRKDYDNLYLLEPICHGIPCQAMLDSYKNKMEERYKSKIIDIQFRNKTLGWHCSGVQIQFANGKKYLEPITIDAYMRAFLSGTTQKATCYQCRFKNLQSGSDLTLGDFWGAEKTMPQNDDNKGLSAVFVNTEKGLRLLKALPIELFPANVDEIIKYNRNVIEPTKRNELRNDFYNFAQSYGYGEAIDHFFRESKKEKMIRKTKYKVHCAYNKMSGRSKPLY